MIEHNRSILFDYVRLCSIAYPEPGAVKSRIPHIFYPENFVLSLEGLYIQCIALLMGTEKNILILNILKLLSLFPEWC